MKELTLFENTMRLFFGAKAYGIACLANNPKEKKKWIKKIAIKMTEIIDTIETSEKHKQNLMHQLKEILSSLKETKDISDDIIFHLLKFCGLLLGFAYLTGGIYRNILYYQNEDQHYASVDYEGGDSHSEKRNDHNNIISTRAKLVFQLKTEGFSNYNIARILNITEYQVNQLNKLVMPHET